MRCLDGRQEESNPAQKVCLFGSLPCCRSRLIGRISSNDIDPLSDGYLGTIFGLWGYDHALCSELLDNLLWLLLDRLNLRTS